MLWVSSALLVLAVVSRVECVRNTPRSARASRNEASLEFECPEEFGYYPHPRDCTQYYVCVFGGALLESCTGGLMYSHELQTCDWPRNVGCLGGGSIAKETEEDDPLLERAAKAESVQLEQQQQQQQQQHRHQQQQQQQQQQSRSHQRPQIQRQQPQVTVTSSSPPVSQITERQSRQRQQHHQRTYQDDEYEPATEIESDRQQRVYRGQPSTIGQVQRDRDGLRRNIISVSHQPSSPSSVVAELRHRSASSNDNIVNQGSSRRDRFDNGQQNDFHPNPTPDPAPRRSRIHASSIDTQPDDHRPNHRSASHVRSPFDERLEDEISNDRVSVTVTSVSSSTTTTTLLQRPGDESEIDETRTPNPLHRSSSAAEQGRDDVAGPEAGGEVPVTFAARSTLLQPRCRSEEAAFSSPSSVAHWQRSTEEVDKNEIGVTSSSAFRQRSTVALLNGGSEEPQVSPAGATGSRNLNQHRSRNDDLLASSPSWLRSTEDLERNEISVSPGPAGRGFMIKRIRPDLPDSYDEEEVPVTAPYAPQRSTTAQLAQDDQGESRNLEVSVSPPSIRQRSRNGLTSSTFPPRASEKFTTITDDRQSLARRNSLGDQENRKYYVASNQPYNSAATTETVEVSTTSAQRILVDEPVDQKTITDRYSVPTMSTARRNSLADQENRKYYVASNQPYNLASTTATSNLSAATGQRTSVDDPKIQKTIIDRYSIPTMSTARRNSLGDQENRKYYVASNQPYNSPATTETAEVSTTPAQRILADEPVDQKTITDRYSVPTMSTARRNSLADQENRKYYVASVQPYSSASTTETSNLSAATAQRASVDDPKIQKTVVQLGSSGDALGEKKYYIPSVQQRSSYNQEASTSSSSQRAVSTDNETPSLITENTKTTVVPPNPTAEEVPPGEKKVDFNTVEEKNVGNLEKNGNLEDPTRNEIFVAPSSTRRRSGSTSSTGEPNEPEGNEIPSSRRPSVGVRSRQRASVRGQSRRKPQDATKRSSRPEREKDSVVNSRGQTESHYRAISSESPRIAKTTASTAAPVSKAYYSDADQSYPYYTIYDDDVSIYKDDDYAQYTVNHTAQIQQQQQQHQQQPQHHQHQHQNVRIAEVTPNSNQYSQKPKKVPVNDADKYNLSPEVTVSDYDIYDSQPLKNKFRISDGHQSLRTNGLSHPVLHVTTPNAIVDTYVPLTTTTQPPPTTTARPYTVTVQNRGRPQVNRGTAPPRLRPTLKPSTAIVSKAQEYVDIYRYPPVRPGPIYPTPTVDKPAAKCRKDVCLLPDCSCGGADIPGDYLPEEIPQIVILTFDDSVNDLNKGLYSDLFEKGRKNPNGCPISATFYVSHEWTDYSQVQNLYATGHEIASHTVSHSFGEQFSARKWSREVAGQREILAAYGGVKLEDVRGMRAPFLSVGGNNMFKMLWDTNFTYDSSMPIYENRPPSWPYTLDYKLFHDCMIPPCPTRSYPGLWEVPMVMWQDLNGGRCSMGDACSNPPTPDGVYKMLIKNFERHYTTNRAPFGLFYHAAWFTQPHHKEGFISFLDTIVAMDDVWVVTNWQALQWVRNPTPLGLLDTFEPFGCNYPDRPKKCNNAKVCNLWHKSGVRYMKTCQPCPDIYPWTGKTGIRSSRIDNEVEK